MENNDLSRSIVIMLVIVAVVVSLLGTWTVLEESKRLQATQSPKSDTEVGKVSIQIIEPPKTVHSVTGKVSINIIDKGE